MNVKELREALKDCDENSTVLMETNTSESYFFEVERVDTFDEVKLGSVILTVE